MAPKSLCPLPISHIALLADAVGIDITVDETESSVGDFNVDIFASEGMRSPGTPPNNHISAAESRLRTHFSLLPLSSRSAFRWPQTSRQARKYRCGTALSRRGKIIKNKEKIVNKTFLQLMEKLGYDIELTYVKREEEWSRWSWLVSSSWFSMIIFRSVPVSDAKISTLKSPTEDSTAKESRNAEE